MTRMQSTNPGNRIRKRLAPESSVGSMPCPSACSPSLPPNWVPNLFFHAWVLTLATSQTDNVSGPLHPLWASELYIQAIDCWPLWHGPVSARICRPKLSLPPFLETIPSTPPGTVYTALKTCPVYVAVYGFQVFACCPQNSCSPS